ncbi:hypothetical protein [Philosamia cynthia ricini nucleopolyhedrovirus virus]|nr:hypothetical protein [Philosamia cynthia ricini nucleopolyhedrovirus virus]
MSALGCTLILRTPAQHLYAHNVRTASIVFVKRVKKSYETRFKVSQSRKPCSAMRQRRPCFSSITNLENRVQLCVSADPAFQV